MKSRTTKNGGNSTNELYSDEVCYHVIRRFLQKRNEMFNGMKCFLRCTEIINVDEKFSDSSTRVFSIADIVVCCYIEPK